MRRTPLALAITLVSASFLVQAEAQKPTSTQLDGVAYYARRPYVIYSDSSKNITGACSRDPSSPAFTVRTVACGEPDSGMTIQYIMNEASMRVNLTDCQ